MANNNGWGGKREGAGRPKKEQLESVKELLAEHIDEATVAEKLRELIDKGDIRAVELWLKYVHGTPKQQIDATIKHSGDVDFKITDLLNFEESEQQI